MKVSITGVGKKEINEIASFVRKPILALDDMRPAWLVIRNDLQKVVWPSQFDKEGGYSGSGWKMLSAAYAKMKARRFPGTKILERTGKMKKSFTEGGDGWYQLLQPLSMEVGSNLKTPNGRYGLAMLHQMGTKKMPARPIIGLSARENTKYPEIMGEYINKAFEK